MTVKERHQALISLTAVKDRLTAWRDNAKLMLTSCLPEDEDRWRNELDNYTYLVTCLDVVEPIIKAEC